MIPWALCLVVVWFVVLARALLSTMQQRQRSAEQDQEAESENDPGGIHFMLAQVASPTV